VVVSKGYDFRLPNDELASCVVKVSVDDTSFVSREGVDKRLDIKKLENGCWLAEALRTGITFCSRHLIRRAIIAAAQ
jgi:hypothetical protein